MTACIVGWSHPPFGKHEGRDVESLIVEAAPARHRRCRARARPRSTRSFSATSTAASSRRTSPARSCSRPTRPCASSPRPGSRTPAPPARPRSIRACARSRPGPARIVLVVGVEKMTELAGPAIGDTLLRAAYVDEEKGIEGGFAGVFGQIAAELFPALRRPVRRAGRASPPRTTRTAAPTPGADAQGSGLRVLPHRSPTRTRWSPAR